jgi:membrane associated rhomboid family serine protease
VANFSLVLPIRDHTPRTRFPVVTLALVAVNAFVYLFGLVALDEPARRALVEMAGAIPYEIANKVDLPPRDLLPLPGSIWTAMFLHGGILHLVGNMWFLWLFGDNVEDALGRVRYLLFYFFAGTVGAVAQILSMPDSTVPMIGASGCVAGVLGAYAMFYPRARVDVAVPFLWQYVALPAWLFLGLWFLGQLLLPGSSGVAWMAHVGGFLAGVGAARLFLQRRRPAVTAPEVEYIPPPPRRRR